MAQMTSISELRITWEGDSAPSVKTTELRETWARIEIHGGGDVVTLVEDRESGSSGRSIFCPLYPLAEWIAYNWWFLKADARPASQFIFANVPNMTWNRGVTADAIQRHNLRSAGDGFIW